MRLLNRAATMAAALLLLAAGPVSADVGGRRSSDACTHNWSGPQVCISITGHDNWADHLTATWTDPGDGVAQSTAILHEGDRQREVHIRQVGTRRGGKIVAEWTDIQLAWGKACVSFTDTGGVWACQDVYATGRA